MIKMSVPSADGYYMPAEYALHEGTVLIWPVRPGSWPYGGKEAKEVFARIARELAKDRANGPGEKVWMLCEEGFEEEVKRVFAPSEDHPEHARIQAVVIPTNDAWARDVGPTCVIKQEENGTGSVRGVNWKFNAWGGSVDGLYADWEKDDAAAMEICDRLNLHIYDANPFVLEGGSIHSDGEGTILTTEACLLSKGRNPDLSKQEIEDRLKTYLGASKIVWIPRGIYNDETNEHVDNVAAFAAPGEVILAWTEEETDPQYALSQASYEALKSQTDAMGRPFRIHKMLIPKVPVCVTEKDLEGYVFEEGEDVRDAGERLAASYVNFYIGNRCVLVPQFGDENDAAALALLQSLFPNREVVGIEARAIILGGGNIHCITQQIPAV